MNKNRNCKRDQYMRPKLTEIELAILEGLVQESRAKHAARRSKAVNPAELSLEEDYSGWVPFQPLLWIRGSFNNAAVVKAYKRLSMLNLVHVGCFGQRGGGPCTHLFLSSDGEEYVERLGI
jgi:hypothetical protein